MQPDAYKEALRTWLCRGCQTPKSTCLNIDAHLLESAPADPPLNFIQGCGLGIVKNELLDQIGMDYVSKNLLLGRVFGRTGQVIENWVTFRGKERLLIRGSKNVSHRECTECGRIVYFANGMRYLYPTPSESLDIYESDLFGLILREHLFARISGQRWPRVHVDRLDVLDSPKDGLGTLN